MILGDWHENFIQTNDAKENKQNYNFNSYFWMTNVATCNDEKQELKQRTCFQVHVYFFDNVIFIPVVFHEWIMNKIVAI